MSPSLGRFLKTRERLVHISMPLKQQKIVLHPSIEAGGITLPEVAMEVWVPALTRGLTDNRGRNKAKREARGR